MNKAGPVENLNDFSPLSMVNVLNRTYLLEGKRFPRGETVDRLGESGRIPLSILVKALGESIQDVASKLKALEYVDEGFNVDGYLNHRHPKWYLARLLNRVPGLAGAADEDPNFREKAREVVTRSRVIRSGLFSEASGGRGHVTGGDSE